MKEKNCFSSTVKISPGASMQNRLRDVAKPSVDMTLFPKKRKLPVTTSNTHQPLLDLIISIWYHIANNKTELHLG